MKTFLRVLTVVVLASGLFACGGGSPNSGVCVEQYSLDTLKQRDFAFDGTVTSVTRATTETGPDRVTFHVTEWYRGGTSQDITLDAYGASSTGSNGGPSFSNGTRLLVTGEGTTVWSCGFTQAWSSATATQWKQALAP